MVEGGWDTGGLGGGGVENEWEWAQAWGSRRNASPESVAGGPRADPPCTCHPSLSSWAPVHLPSTRPCSSVCGASAQALQEAHHPPRPLQLLFPKGKAAL